MIAILIFQDGLCLLSDRSFNLWLCTNSHFNMEYQSFTLEYFDRFKYLVNPVKVLLLEIFEASQLRTITKWLLLSLCLLLVLLISIIFGFTLLLLGLF